MSGKNIFYVILLIVSLILLGGVKPKIAISLAALIFFGAVVLNADSFKKLMKGDISA